MDLFQWLKELGNQPPDERTPPEDSPGPPVRRRYRFSGLVQGVGFRWEAKTLAGQLGLTGWARNESDGTVVVEIEGGADRIDRFLRAMRRVSRFDITDIEAEDLPPVGNEKTFGVLF